MNNPSPVKSFVKSIVRRVRRVSSLRRHPAVKRLLGWKIYYLLEISGRSRSILRLHYHAPHNPQYIPGVVYLANGFDRVGGLADRLKGMMEVYDWCVRHHRPFYIHFDHPFLLQRYLEPNEYDWRIRPEQLSFSPRDTRVVAMRLTSTMYRDCHGDTASLFLPMMARYSRDTRKQTHVFCHMHLSSYDPYVCFHQLFRPTPLLQSAVDHHRHNIGGSYISVSFRFTTLLGDLHDSVNQPLPPEERTRLINRCKEELENIANDNPSVNHIFVATDSNTFASEVASMPKVYTIPGQVCHIDMSPEDANDEAILKVFLDFYMIMSAERVYLVKIGDMYNSNFPKIAAIAGGKPFELRERPL